MCIYRSTESTHPSPGLASTPLTGNMSCVVYVYSVMTHYLFLLLQFCERKLDFKLVLRTDSMQILIDKSSKIVQLRLETSSCSSKGFFNHFPGIPCSGFFDFGEKLI